MLFRGFGPMGFEHGGGLAMVFMMLFWAVVIGLIVFAAVRMARHAHGCCPPAARDALDIARERYARGDIDEKEYEKIKKNLS